LSYRSGKSTVASHAQFQELAGTGEFASVELAVADLSFFDLALQQSWTVALVETDSGDKTVQQQFDLARPDETTKPTSNSQMKMRSRCLPRVDMEVGTLDGWRSFTQEEFSSNNGFSQVKKTLQSSKWRSNLSCDFKAGQYTFALSVDGDCKAYRLAADGLLTPRCCRMNRAPASNDWPA
jgi:hypothetical protein